MTEKFDRDRIALVFRLEDLEVDEEAGIARYSMTVEAVERWLPGFIAAIEGLEPVDVEVHGEG